MIDGITPPADSDEFLIKYGAPETFGRVIESLFSTIQHRSIELPEGSYTASLLQGHEDALLKKIGEEATEVVIAAKSDDPDQLRYEAADLMYHLLVVLQRWGLTPDDVARELSDRFK